MTEPRPAKHSCADNDHSGTIVYSMSSATQRLDEAVAECEDLGDTITRQLRSLDSLQGEQRRSVDSQIESNLNRMDLMINKMTSDIRSIPANSKDYYESEINEARSRYSKCLAELRQKRQALLNDPANRQREQLESNYKKSTNVVSKLDEAIRIGNETNLIANETMATLIEDRETITKIDDNLLGINNEAITGQQKAKRMLRRAWANSCLAWTIFVILLAFLGFSLIMKLVVLDDDKDKK